MYVPCIQVLFQKRNLMFAMEVFKKLQYIDRSTRASRKLSRASSAGLELCKFLLLDLLV